MKVLITGGAGFIGSHLARRLVIEGCEVTVLDNLSLQVHGDRPAAPSNLDREIRFVRGDVSDPRSWETCVAGQNAVVHLAAETGTGQSMYKVANYERVNIGGTALLYDLLSQNPSHSIERIVLASSRAIYGEGAYNCPEHGRVYPAPRTNQEKLNGEFDPVCPVCAGPSDPAPTPETAPLQPSSFYGLTKQVQEQTALLFGRVLGIPTFALRYQNVYGPGQSLKNPYTGILAIFSNLARVGADIDVFEDGKESRDFVHIDDIVRATAVCVSCAANGAVALNIGSNERISVLEVAQAVNQFFGGKSTVLVSGAFREGDIRHGIADTRNARNLLGYKPEVSFYDGLKTFLGWACESDAETGSYERSLNEMRERGLLHAR